MAQRVAEDPMALLARDRERARTLSDPLADLCWLATLDAEGHPALRTLVVRGIDAHALRIFVNCSSPKWAELHASGRFELLCYYPGLRRQYRLRGRIEELDRAMVHRSWRAKPRATRLLDWYYQHEHRQSARLASREELIAGYRRMQVRYPDPDAMPAPEGVRGLALVAQRVERLDLDRSPVHERRSFTLHEGGWREAPMVP